MRLIALLLHKVQSFKGEARPIQTGKTRLAVEFAPGGHDEVLLGWTSYIQRASSGAEFHLLFQIMFHTHQAIYNKHYVITYCIIISRI